MSDLFWREINKLCERCVVPSWVRGYEYITYVGHKKATTTASRRESGRNHQVRASPCRNCVYCRQSKPRIIMEIHVLRPLGTPA